MADIKPMHNPPHPGEFIAQVYLDESSCMKNVRKMFAVPDPLLPPS
ncbi:MAG: hypothetical protein HOK48_05795 [Actinobacteria bacterium]|nr:hypothetical protein [Actinomycetota bacterium]